MAEEHDNSEKQIIRKLQADFDRAKTKAICVLDKMTLENLDLVGEQKFVEIIQCFDSVAKSGFNLINKQVNTWKHNPFGEILNAEWKDRARYGRYETEVFKYGTDLLWQITNLDGGHVVHCSKTWKVTGFAYTAVFNKIGRMIGLCKSVNFDAKIRRG